jgi:hypothetical protein
MTGKQNPPKLGRCAECKRRKATVYRCKKRWLCYECFIADEMPTIDDFVYCNGNFAEAGLQSPGLIGKLTPKGSQR